MDMVWITELCAQNLDSDSDFTELGHYDVVKNSIGDVPFNSCSSKSTL